MGRVAAATVRVVAAARCPAAVESELDELDRPLAVHQIACRRPRDTCENTAVVNQGGSWPLSAAVAKSVAAPARERAAADETDEAVGERRPGRVWVAKVRGEGEPGCWSGLGRDNAAPTVVRHHPRLLRGAA
eukprot:352171-Prymnesium_polylepis.1